MTVIETVMPYVQVILSIALIGAILLQRSEAGLGSGFGGDAFAVGHHERRGFERTLFIATIVIAILFAISAFIILILE